MATSHISMVIEKWTNQENSTISMNMYKMKSRHGGMCLADMYNTELHVLLGKETVWTNFRGDMILIWIQSNKPNHKNLT